jgi:hypothetical protein
MPLFALLFACSQVLAALPACCAASSLRCRFLLPALPLSLSTYAFCAACFSLFFPASLNAPTCCCPRSLQAIPAHPPRCLYSCFLLLPGAALLARRTTRYCCLHSAATVVVPPPLLSFLPLYCRSLPHATAATCYRPLLPLLSALYCRHPPAAPAALVLRLLLWSLPASISSSLRHPMLPPAAVCMLLRSLLRSLFCCTLRRLLCCLR